VEHAASRVIHTIDSVTPSDRERLARPAVDLRAIWRVGAIPGVGSIVAMPRSVSGVSPPPILACVISAPVLS
jgi:hypothetical protein